MPEVVDLKEGDYVEAFGLVGARHLNGKFGLIIEKASGATSGRVTVDFLTILRLDSYTNWTRPSSSSPQT